MIHVLATVEVQPGKRAAFLEEFRRLMPKVRQERGCLEYGPAIDCATDVPVQQQLGPNVVMVVEKWESVAALKDHLVAAHMHEYRQRVKDVVRGVRLNILESAE